MVNELFDDFDLSMGRKFTHDEFKSKIADLQQQLKIQAFRYSELQKRGAEFRLHIMFLLSDIKTEIEEAQLISQYPGE